MRTRDLKAFLHLSVVFGVISGLFAGLSLAYISIGDPFVPMPEPSALLENVLFTALIGAPLGGLLALLLGWRHNREVRKLVPEPSEEDFGLTPQRNVNVGSDLDAAPEMCSEALEQLPGAGPVTRDRGIGTATVRTGGGLGSWGEEVHAAVRAEGDGSEITVGSRPVLGIMPYDFGKSLRNVLSFERLVTELAEDLRS